MSFDFPRPGTPIVRLTHTCTLALAFLLSAGTAFAAPDSLDDRVARVERGLRAPVSFVGEPTWTIEERMRHYGVPGVAIAVIDDSRVVWTRYYGKADREAGTPVTARTLFQAGSVSKPVAAMGAMTMVEKGQLTLSRPVNEQLKTWRIPENSFTRATPVTLTHLLSHTGGLTVHGFGGYAVDAKVPGIVEILDGKPPANSAAVRVDKAPGAGYRYSGGGYTVAQLLMTDVAKRPFARLMHHSVLEPIGMLDSTFVNPLPPRLLRRAAAGVLPDSTSVPGKRHTYPEMAAAGLWTTATDLARIATEMQRAWRGESKVLSKRSAEIMLTEVAQDYGLGFGLPIQNGETYFGHGGWDEGFCASLIAHPTAGKGVAILINANQPQFQDELRRAVAFEYAWPGYRPYTRVATSAAALTNFPGRYRYNSEQAAVIVRDGEGLRLQYAGEDPVELIAIGENRFLRRDSETPVAFARGANGATVMSFELPDGGLQRHEPLPESERMPRELLVGGERERALAAYRRLAEAKDEAASEDYLNKQGMRLVRQKRFDTAILLLEANTVLYADSAKAWGSLGYAYSQMGDDVTARRHYEKALAIDPSFASVIEALRELDAKRPGRRDGR